MDTKALRQFLLYCGREGYANIGDDGQVKESDKSTSITLTQNDWKFHDNYFGGEPYGGREVIFFKDKPVWMMVYYGRVLDNSDVASLYGFLRQALAAVPDDAPFRGPEELVKDDLTYTNNWVGEIENFSGKESISQNGQIIYEASYIGGLVDQ